MSRHIDQVIKRVAEFVSIYRLSRGLAVHYLDEGALPFARALFERYAERARGRICVGLEGRETADVIIGSRKEAPEIEDLLQFASRLGPAGLVAFLQTSKWNEAALQELRSKLPTWEWENWPELNLSLARPLPELSQLKDAFGVSLEKPIYGALLPGGYLFPYKKWTLLVGRSGAGKTTLVQLASGLLSFAHATRINPPSSVFYVPQSVDVIDDESVLVNIALFAKDIETAKRAGEAVGLQDKFNRRADSKLSGGEYQRVMLAQALCAAPDALVMDEPFSGLDHLRRLELLGSLQRSSGEWNAKTVVCVAHDFHIMEEFFEVILELLRGRLYCVRATLAR